MSGGNRGGTVISIFNVADSNISSWGAQQGIPVQDSYIFAVKEEKKNNVVIPIILNDLVKKATKKGFTIEVENSVMKNVITNPDASPYLINLWASCLKQAIHHRTLIGYAAVQLRPLIRNKQEIKDPAPEIRGSQDDSEEEGDPGGELDRFLHEEILNTQAQRKNKKKPPKLTQEDILEYTVPRVMDPWTEYSLRFITKKDGSRIYKAYSRKDTQIISEIPNSFVFVFFEPDAQGVPSSPILDCFDEIQSLRGFRRRLEQRDVRITMPPIIYTDMPKSDAIIPNTTRITSADVNQDFDHTSHQTDRPTVTLPSESLEKRYAQLILANRYLKLSVAKISEFFTETRVNRKEPGYNHQLDRVTDIPVVNPLEPFSVLPEHVQIASNIPKIQVGENTDSNLRLMLSLIAAATGVLPEVLNGQRPTITAEVSRSRENNDDQVKVLQTELERFVAEVYIEIFAPLYKDNVDYAVDVSRSKVRSEHLENVKHNRDETRHELTEMIDELSEQIAAAGEENERASITKDRTMLQRKLAMLDDPLNSEQMDLISAHDPQSAEYYKIKLEQEAKIMVKFHENPTLTSDDILQMRNAKAITRETSRKMLLDVYGIPHNLLATEAELTKEIEFDLKHKRPAEDTIDSSAKRLKTDDTSPPIDPSK